MIYSGGNMRSGKVALIIAGVILFQTFGGVLLAADKTVQINIDACWS